VGCSGVCLCAGVMGGVEETEGWVDATTSEGSKLLRSLRSESRSKSDSGALRGGTGGYRRHIPYNQSTHQTTGSIVNI